MLSPTTIVWAGAKLLLNLCSFYGLPWGTLYQIRQAIPLLRKPYGSIIKKIK